MEIQLPFLISALLLIVFAYLLGSLPTAVWLGKRLRGIDVRDHGSGNAGATNAMRVLGPRIGFVVLLIDALKAIAAVSLSYWIQGGFTSPDLFVVFQILLGAVAITGHVFPVFASFKGGKGIASLVGLIIVLLPEAFLISLGIFLLVFLLTRYVSLGSLIAAIALPFIVILVKEVTLLPKVIFAVAIALFVPVTHKNNIRRLLQGKENRISFKR